MYIVGSLEAVEGDAEQQRHAKCFLAKHPDAAIVAPGKDIHSSGWYTLKPESIYYFGMFSPSSPTDVVCATVGSMLTRRSSSQVASEASNTSASCRKTSTQRPATPQRWQLLLLRPRIARDAGRSSSSLDRLPSPWRKCRMDVAPDYSIGQ